MVRWRGVKVEEVVEKTCSWGSQSALERKKVDPMQQFTDARKEHMS